MIKGLVGHTDSVTGLILFENSDLLVSTGHDGSLRTWDIRKYQCLHEMPVKLILFLFKIIYIYIYSLLLLNKIHIENYRIKLINYENKTYDL